jgi:hypothetical protein
MAVVTIARLAEECMRIIYGGNVPDAGKVSPEEVKIACGQVANNLLKTEYFQVNAPAGEMIPNGAVLGLYLNIPIQQWKDRSRAKLPIKPMKLPRGMGVYSVFPNDDPGSEYIPIELGQANLLKSQPMLSDLLGQVGYEAFDDYVYFTRDLTLPNQTLYCGMRLVILDISLYGDWDLLPVTPEIEWEIKKQVTQMFALEPPADKLVDPGTKELKGVPVKEQNQP